MLKLSPYRTGAVRTITATCPRLLHTQPNLRTQPQAKLEGSRRKPDGAAGKFWKRLTIDDGMSSKWPEAKVVEEAGGDVRKSGKRLTNDDGMSLKRPEAKVVEEAGGDVGKTGKRLTNDDRMSPKWPEVKVLEKPRCEAAGGDTTRAPGLSVERHEYEVPPSLSFRAEIAKHLKLKTRERPPGYHTLIYCLENRCFVQPRRPTKNTGEDAIGLFFDFERLMIPGMPPWREKLYDQRGSALVRWKIDNGPKLLLGRVMGSCTATMREVRAKYVALGQLPSIREVDEEDFQELWHIEPKHSRVWMETDKDGMPLFVWIALADMTSQIRKKAKRSPMLPRFKGLNRHIDPDFHNRFPQEVSPVNHKRPLYQHEAERSLYRARLAWKSGGKWTSERYDLLAHVLRAFSELMGPNPTQKPPILWAKALRRMSESDNPVRDIPVMVAFQEEYVWFVWKDCPRGKLVAQYTGVWMPNLAVLPEEVLPMPPSPPTAEKEKVSWHEPVDL